MKNYYEILGLEKTASEQDIKQAYRKLAKTHHPDLGGDVKKFQELQEAFETLSDPVKRAEHDNPQPKFNRQSRQYSYHEEFGDFGGFSNDPTVQELFQKMFEQQTRRTRQTNRSVQIQTSISLEDAFYGKDLTANLEMPSGNVQTIQFKIPAGIADRMTLNLAGLGDDTHKDIPRGDIHLNIHVQPHQLFERQGNDLIQELEISSIEAILGCTKVVTSIDKKELKTTIPAGIENDTILSLPGYGMPDVHSQKRGRFILKVQITTSNLNDKQKEELKKLTETWS